MKKKKGIAITTDEAALIINATPQFVRLAMQQGKLPIGTAIQSSKIWTYNIQPKLLADYTGIDVIAELERIRGREVERV